MSDRATEESTETPEAAQVARESPGLAAAADQLERIARFHGWREAHVADWSWRTTTDSIGREEYLGLVDEIIRAYHGADGARVAIELTPYMLDRVNQCREPSEPLENAVLDLVWLGALTFTRDILSRSGATGGDHPPTTTAISDAT